MWILEVETQVQFNIRDLSMCKKRNESALL